MNGGTDTEPSTTAASGSGAAHRWSVTALAVAHKRAAAGSIAVVSALIAVTIATTVSSPSRQPLSDAATCTQWAAGTPAQKIGYSHVYIDEYGRFANTARNAHVVETAIDKACTKAADLGEADDLSVLGGIRHAF